MSATAKVGLAANRISPEKRTSNNFCIAGEKPTSRYRSVGSMLHGMTGVVYNSCCHPEFISPTPNKPIVGEHGGRYDSTFPRPDVFHPSSSFEPSPAVLAVQLSGKDDPQP